MKRTFLVLILLFAITKVSAQTKEILELEKKCTLGDNHSCIILAANLSRDKEKKESGKKAKKMFEKMCNEKHPQSCSYLGAMYIEGVFVKQNYSKGIKLHKKACELNSGFGCRNLAKIYYEGKIVKFSVDKVIDYYKKACTLNNSLTYCEELLNTSSKMFAYTYASDALGKKSEDKKIVLEKVCKTDDAESCYYLFLRLERDKNDIEAKKYLLKTKSLMERDCNNNSANGCGWIGSFYANNGNKTKALKYFTKAKNLFKKECDDTDLLSSCMSHEELINLEKEVKLKL